MMVPTFAPLKQEGALRRDLVGMCLGLEHVRSKALDAGLRDSVWDPSFREY